MGYGNYLAKIVNIFKQAGQEKFRSITISFYKETKGAFVVFDLTNRFISILYNPP
jgi:GTPase SAR1 family protein